MDTWSIVAAYLVRRDADCSSERRGGAQLACVSKMHLDAMQHAVREKRFEKCARPLKLKFEENFSFCLLCPHGFEHNVLGPLRLCNYNYKVLKAPCIESEDFERCRYSLCLADAGGRRCANCGGLCEDRPAPRSLNFMKHDKNCNGCMDVMPVICGLCRRSVSYVPFV